MSSSAAGSVGTIYARWEEVPGSITYTAVTVDATTGERTPTKGGYVSVREEHLPAVSGTPVGSSAYVLTGYTFVRWIDEWGNTVSWDATFVPTKGIYGVYRPGLHRRFRRQRWYGLARRHGLHLRHLPHAAHRRAGWHHARRL